MHGMAWQLQRAATTQGGMPVPLTLVGRLTHLICSLPGVTMKGTFALMPAASACFTRLAARLMSS